MTTIPIDVLLYVIEFIDHPKDLLSLALTARHLHAAIVPRHIDYRRISISCTKSSEHVWKHLLDTPHACSCIRYLNILIYHGRTEVPRICRIPSATRPRIFSGDDNRLNVISDTFIQALSKMVNLKVPRFETTGRNHFFLISEAIGKAGCDLEELEVHFGTSSTVTAIEQRSKKDKVSKDLKTFSLFCDYLPSLRKYIIQSRYQYDGRVPLQMLLNTPNLTYMNVASGLSSAFFSGCWPNLQHLKFHNYMSCHPVGKDYLPCLQTFLHRHSKLITLFTDNILLPGWAIESDDFLPNLKSFYINIWLYQHTITTNIAERLMHLKMNTGLYRYLKERGIILSNLETCVFGDVSLEELTQDLVDMAPNIQKLCIIFEPILYNVDFEFDVKEERSIPDYEIMERVSIFAGFKNLRVLIGPFDDISVNSHLLPKVLYDLPRLLYTRLLKKNDHKIFRLERDDITQVVRYEHEEVFPDECKFFFWDGMYKHGHLNYSQIEETGIVSYRKHLSSPSLDDTWTITSRQRPSMPVIGLKLSMNIPS